MTTVQTMHSHLPISPGEYLEEVLAELGMTKTELTRRMGRPASKLTPVLRVKKQLYRKPLCDYANLDTKCV